MLPYWMLWMRHHGYSAVEIGWVTSAQVLMTIAGSYFWGMLSDKTGQPMRIVKTALSLSLLLFSAIYLVQDSYAGILLVMAGSSFFWQGVFAQFELVTLRHLAEQSSRYSLIRLTGSAGFVLCVWGIGQLLSVFHITMLPTMILMVMATLWLAGMLNQGGARQQSRANAVSVWPMLRRPTILMMVVLFFLSNASHGSYYGFFSLYLEEHGFAEDTIGNLWSVAVIFELLLFAALPWVLQRVSVNIILLISLALTAVRWALMSTNPDDLWMLAVLQIMHGFSFSWVHSIAIMMFKQFFTGDTEGRGQAMYGGICVAGGQATGIACAGWLWHLGSGVTFGISAGVALAATLLALWVVYQQRQPHRVAG